MAATRPEGSLAIGMRRVGGAAEASRVARERAFESFVAAHRERAVALAWRLVGGDPAAEDVAQEAFARAFRGLDGLRDESRLPGWFARILLNEVQRHRRWRWVRQRFAAEMPESPRDARAPVGADALLRERVAAALDRLPRGQREAFVLVHLEGYTVGEVAGITGRATGTVKSHLARALRALRAQLADLAPQLEAGRR